MARPKNSNITIFKRLRSKKWQLHFRKNGGRVAFSIGEITERDAEQKRLELQLAFSTENWPAWIKELSVWGKLNPATNEHSESNVVNDYASTLNIAASQGELSGDWVKASISTIKKVAETCNVNQMSIRDAENYLQSHNTIATRNRHLAIFSKFYKWGIHTERLQTNPFAGFKRAKEREKNAEIIHLSLDERNEVLKAANTIEGGLAIQVALYTGMRRGEIIRLKWKHVNFDSGKIFVPLAKPGRGRPVDMAKKIIQILRKQTAKSGSVMSWPEEKLPAIWCADEVLNAMREKLRKNKSKIPPEKILWNVFRHTFASLLVQKGISLFKVSSWLGNSIEVCKKHYASMSPTRDDDIDAIN